MSLEIYEYLNELGVKPSPQRVAILDYLKSHSNHPTADQIFTELAPEMPTLSKMTVYNTLNLLSEKNAILALNVDDKQTRFDGDTSLHAHCICTRCGMVEDIKILNDSFVEMNTPKDFKINDVQLIYKGICKECIIQNNN